MWRLDLIVTAELFYTSASFWNNLLGGHSAGKQSSELLFSDSPFLIASHCEICFIVSLLGSLWVIKKCLSYFRAAPFWWTNEFRAGKALGNIILCNLYPFHIAKKTVLLLCTDNSRSRWIKVAAHPNIHVNSISSWYQDGCPFLGSVKEWWTWGSLHCVVGYIGKE